MTEPPPQSRPQAQPLAPSQAQAEPARKPQTCCAPARDAEAQEGPQDVTRARIAASERAPKAAAPRRPPSVLIPGGTALIGTDRPELPADGEGPARTKRLRPFRMAETAVTNAEFAAFVEATGHVTEAERFGWSFVFWSDVPERLGPTQAVAGVTWWRRVDGATWRDIHGPGSHAESWRPEHPVVQIAWTDAVAYAAWAGGRLPTEAEWEHAARGGLGDVRFPWGTQEPQDTGPFPCNIWQGPFPDANSCADGWRGTAPARSFAPNGYGLYNMVGNVWEWTAEAYRVKSLKKEVRARLRGMRGYKLLKGGSFLCHRSYCYRYRIAARTGNSPDSTTTHQGLRVVWDA